jgi:hypothetical protein
MNKKLILAGILGLIFSAQSYALDRAHKIDRQMDRMGDHINDRLDAKGDRINRRLDHKADRLEAHGFNNAADRMDRKGDRIDRRLDVKGDRIERRLDNQGDRLVDKWSKKH